MEPRWLPIEEITAIFSQHHSYAETDEMRRGMYLREYTALRELTEKSKENAVLMNHAIEK
ncbi:MAG: hypothetical protein PUC30_04605 [Lachnospiraceae bacterium]|nr:hypothetical protein [Lachnospiraceae bacterium]